MSVLTGLDACGVVTERQSENWAIQDRDRYDAYTLEGEHWSRAGGWRKEVIISSQERTKGFLLGMVHLNLSVKLQRRKCGAEIPQWYYHEQKQIERDSLF